MISFADRFGIALIERNSWPSVPSADVAFRVLSARSFQYTLVYPGFHAYSLEYIDVMTVLNWTFLLITRYRSNPIKLEIDSSVSVRWIQPRLGESELTSNSYW